MLAVGMYGKGNVGIENGCTDTDYKTHFALWCFFASPLMIGGDIEKMNECCEVLLKNKNLIKINQDEEVRTPYKLNSSDNAQDIHSYVKILSDNTLAILKVNFGDEDKDVWFNFLEAGIPYHAGFGLEITNAFINESLGIKRDYFKTVVKAHDCAVYLARFVEV